MRKLDVDPLKWSDQDAAWARQFPEKYREGLARRAAAESSGNPRPAVSPKTSGGAPPPEAAGPWGAKPYAAWSHGDLMDLSARRSLAHGNDYRVPADGRGKANIIEALEAWDSAHPGDFGKVGERGDS